MKKIKILFYSHAIDFGGTWRSHERILLNLNKEQFDVYVFYNPNQNNNRLEFLKTVLSEDRIIPFYASLDKLGPEFGYPYRETNFKELAKEYNFDIIHFARSGYFEWPFNERLCPIQIETNIFGGKDNSEFLDYSVTICNTINDIRGGSDEIIYNPIPKPLKNNDNLLEHLSIPDNYFVFGRIGRKDNFHPIALDAVYELKKERNDFRYIIIGPCEQTINKIKSLNLGDVCILLETTNDDEFIHKFHNTLDLFLHYRSDGECHSTAISQAMSYGIPIISHYAGFNGQIETINNGGFVANNSSEYLNFLIRIVNDVNFYKTISNNAKLQSKKFEEPIIVNKWENIYQSLYFKKIS
jgi:hypothetical protein